MPVLCDSFKMLPSAMHFRLPLCKENTRKFGSIPEAIDNHSTRDGKFTLCIDI